MSINYVNEKVQQIFAKMMIQNEQDWYDKENLEIPKIPFLDNTRILGT